MENQDPYSSECLKRKLTSLISDHEQAELVLLEDTKLYNNADETTEMRQKKVLMADEIHVPDRTVASNINQQQARLISYIKNGESLVTFGFPFANPEQQSLLMARAERITKGIRVSGWEQPWYKVAHNGLLFGRAFIHVLQDSTKPMQVAFEHVHTRDMLTPRGFKDLQTSHMLAVRHKLTSVSFEEFSRRYRWNMEVAKSLLDKYAKVADTAPYEVYHVFYKQPSEDGSMTVMHYWYTHTDNGRDLTEPTEYMTGLINLETLQPRPAAQYPFAMYLRRWDSNDLADEVRGQGELDAPTQASLSMMQTALTNGTFRASKFILSPPPEKGADPVSMENLELKHGIFSPIPLDTFQPAYPGSQIVSFMNQLRGVNLQQLGATDFAAMTRDDTEKRVKELAYAKQMGDLLAESSVAPWAHMCHEAFSMAWTIIQSQALLGEVHLEEEQDSLLLPVVVAPYGEYESMNRARYRQRLLEFWAIVQGRPGELPFYEELLREFFPLQSRRWFEVQQVIDAANQKTEQLSSILLQLGDTLAQHAQQQPALVPIVQQLANVLAQLGLAPNDGNAAPAPAGPQRAA